MGPERPAPPLVPNPALDNYPKSGGDRGVWLLWGLGVVTWLLVSVIALWWMWHG